MEAAEAAVRRSKSTCETEAIKYAVIQVDKHDTEAEPRPPHTDAEEAVPAGDWLIRPPGVWETPIPPASLRAEAAAFVPTAGCKSHRAYPGQAPQG